MAADFAGPNGEYVANFGDKGALALPPAKKVSLEELFVTVLLRKRFAVYGWCVGPCFDRLHDVTFAAVTCMDARIEYVSNCQY